MHTVSLWWRAVRPFSFTVSVFPPILGGILAVIDYPSLDFHWAHFMLALVGCVIAHAGANLLDDYYDYKKGVDREGTYGSSGLLVEKIMRPAQILAGGWIALAIAGSIGIYFMAVLPNGLFLLWVIIIGGVFGVFYTAGPVTFKYRALGDIAVFVSFGSAMALGAYFVQIQRFSWTPVLYALPAALLVDAVLHSNNLRDIKNDREVNITTVPILIGERGSKLMYAGLVFGAYVLTVILALTAGLTWVSVITFLSFPIAIKNVKTVFNKDNIPEPQFAMIDAATAQHHSAFGILFIVSLLIHHFFLA